MKKFCIVIPIYKYELDILDKLSLNRLNKIVKMKYDLFFVKPESLNCENYYKIFNKELVTEISFKDSYFENTDSYSQLCIQYDFYNTFSDYEYMYIYQTDCYLVKDELNAWCDKGYDYIGAPIISSNANWVNIKNPNKWEPQVGNGGFSLRKIETFKEITDPNGEFRRTYNLSDEQLASIKYEDLYFMNYVAKYYDITTPDWKTALYFAIDMNADVIYDKLKFKELPMGIHAWPKNIRHWQNVLDELKNNRPVIDLCEDLYEEFFKIYYGENNN